MEPQNFVRSSATSFRIGIINDYSPRKIEMQKHSDGRMIVFPPRGLNGLRMKQQSFRGCMEQFKWNYKLEEEEDDKKDEDDDDDYDNKNQEDENDEDDDNKGNTSSSSPTTSNKK
jgi:hypothetical protein